MAVKKNEYNFKRTILDDWQFGIPQYSFEISKPKKDIKVIVIDGLGFMADINPDNNVYLAEENKEK